MKLTVLINTYNSAIYIYQAIQSVLHQTFKDFELLIIDDGSDDNTEELVANFGDKRIKYIKRKHFGRSASLNFGLNNASGNIVALMDADDISHPERLERQIKIVEGNENKICYTRAAYFFESDFKIKFLSENSLHRDIKKIIALHGFFCNSSMMFNKNQILKFGYDETLPSAEDYDLLLRIKDFSEFVLIPEVLLFQRMRKNSLSSTMYKSNNNIIYNIQEIYYQDLSASFEIDSSTEQWNFKGWREFFYGSKKLARKYWLNAGYRNWNLKLMFIFFLTFFPEIFLEFIKNKRLRLRISYQIEKLLHGNKIEMKFNEICRMINE